MFPPRTITIHTQDLEEQPGADAATAAVRSAKWPPFRFGVEVGGTMRISAPSIPSAGHVDHEIKIRVCARHLMRMHCTQFLVCGVNTLQI